MKSKMKFHRQDAKFFGTAPKEQGPRTAKERSPSVFNPVFLGAFASWRFKRGYFFIFLVLLLSWPFFASTSFAQTPTPTPLPGTGDGLAATFYSNPNLTGSTFSTLYSSIAVDWYECSPDPSIPASAFSGRFKGYLEPLYSETYTFSAVVQGGVSVIINGLPVISQWTDSTSISTYTGTIALTALQRVPLEVDYFKTTGLGQIGLFWQSASQANETVPQNHLYSGLPPGPPLPPPQTATASCGENLTLDGQVNGGAWSGAWTPISKVGWGVSTGIYCGYQAKWDSNFLYFGFQVDDPTPHHDSPEPYNNDSIEVFLDTAGNRPATFTSSDFHYTLVWGTNQLLEDNNRLAGVLGQTASLPAGWTATLAIPWSTLGISPLSGALYGFDIGVNLSPLGGCADSKIWWNGSLNDASNGLAFGLLALGPACPSLSPAQQPFFYPEPATGNYVNIAYNMREPGTMKLKVWNAAGNLAATLNDHKGAGNQVSYLPIGGFAAGHYFYQITLSYDSGDEDVFKTRVLPVQK
jgi:hypothetical protein